MNIIEAFEQLYEKHKEIRRQSWGKLDLRLGLDGEGNLHRYEGPYDPVGFYSIVDDDVLAKDWEVFNTQIVAERVKVRKQEILSIQIADMQKELEILFGQKESIENKIKELQKSIPTMIKEQQKGY